MERNTIWRRLRAFVALAAVALLFACTNPLGGNSKGDTTSTGGATSGSSTYTVTYNINGAMSGSVPTDTGSYSAGDTVTVRGNSGGLARSDATFAGWTGAPSGTTTTFHQGDTFSMGSSDVVLYAAWTPNNPSSWNVELYMWTDDASLLPAQVFLNSPDSSTDQYVGCITATGKNNALDAGTYQFSEMLYLKAKYGNGYYGYGLMEMPNDISQTGGVTYTKLSKAGLYDDINLPPDGGWKSGCGSTGSHSLLGTTANIEFIGASSYASHGGLGVIGMGDSAGTTSLLFTLYTSATDGGVDSGTYSLSSSPGVGDLVAVQMEAGITYDSAGVNETSAGAAASTTFATKSDYQTYYGYSVGSYGYITGGSVTVSRSGSDYTVNWSFTTSDGQTISGSYSGTSII